MPAEIWVGIGICYFKLMNFIKAKFAFEHALEIDPQNPMALTSLGITEIAINSSDGKQREKAVFLFQRSFEIDDTNPLTMKNLADHFFNCKELEISGHLIDRALKFSQNYPTTQLRSDLFFLKGKINHLKENYNDALDSYFQCVKLNPNNYAAHFNKAKIHFMNN